MKTKICSKCKEKKSITEFFKNKKMKDGLFSECKECRSKYAKDYRKKNRNRIKKYKREYYKKNKEYIKEKSRKYRKNNPEKVKKAVKRWEKNNPEKKRKNNERWCQKHPHRAWAIKSLYGHKRRGFIINILRLELENLAKHTIYCPICNIKLDWQYGAGMNADTPTIDRKTNEKVLNKDNIWIICCKCNRTKSDRTLKEFIAYCQMIVDKNETLYERMVGSQFQLTNGMEQD